MLFRTTVVALAVAIGAPMVWADELAKQGRAIMDANQEAVISVQTVVQINVDGREREQDGWANATIIDPSGLCVLSLSFIDPFSLLPGNMSGGGTRETKVVTLNMLMGDGKELPAKVVLREKDRDLAFVLPVEIPDEPLPHIDIFNVNQPQLLDHVVIVMQLGQVARRAHAIAIDRVEAVVEKPHEYYVLGEHRSRGVISAPVFAVDGAFVGMGATRSTRAGSGGGMGDDVLVIVVTAQDIQDAVAQFPGFAVSDKAADVDNADDANDEAAGDADEDPEEPTESE